MNRLVGLFSKAWITESMMYWTLAFWIPPLPDNQRHYATETLIILTYFRSNIDRPSSANRHRRVYAERDEHSTYPRASHDMTWIIKFRLLTYND